jgi:nucleoside-diphosphate-sugar epimerase
MSLDVAIIGANGFIGSNLTEHILRVRDDWHVHGLDLEAHRLEELRSHSRFHFTPGDILVDHALVDELVERCDVVLPLAAIATPIRYVRHPLEVFELTFEANLRVVRSCVRFGKRVVFPSSSEVYGMSDDPAFDEETTKLVLGPIDKHRWIYACSKQLLDRVIHAYGMEQGLRYTIFRPFNWIGPRLDYVLDPREGSSRVLTQFIGNVVRRENIKLVDGGYQRRCFLYIDDAVDALMRIIENRDGCADQRIFNVGNPRNDISIRELGELLIELIRVYPGFEDVGEKVTCVDIASKDYYGMGYQDISTRTPAIRNAERFLGWAPRTDLRTAIRRTIEFYLAELESDEASARKGHSGEAARRADPSAGA